MWATLFFYFAVMSACLGLIYWSEENRTKHGIYVAYFVIILISVFRYDIGNDYLNYTEIIQYLATQFQFSDVPLSDETKEPLIYILTYIFQGVKFPYVWVLGIHFIISMLFIYKAFEENKSHFLGIFLFFISGMLFVQWDQVRQGVAIAIIIYAIKYIKEENFVKYLWFVLLASTAHYSALLLLPFYFVEKIRPFKYVYIGVIFALVISNAATDYFVYIFDNIITLIPYYDTKETSLAYVQFLSAGYKFRLFYYGLFWSALIFFLPKEERVLIHFIFVGAIIFIMASGALNIMRISFYFIYTITLSIPIVLKVQKARLTMMVLVLGFFVFFVRDVITDTNTNGCVPYDSIFSDNFAEFYRSRE